MVITYSTPIPPKDQLSTIHIIQHAHPTEYSVIRVFLEWVKDSHLEVLGREIEIPQKPVGALTWPRIDMLCKSKLTDTNVVIEFKGSFNPATGNPRKNVGTVCSRTISAVKQIRKYEQMLALYRPDQRTRYILALPTNELFNQDRAYITDYGIGIYEIEMPDYFAYPTFQSGWKWVLEYDRDLQPSRKGRS